jgi:hypothetical protein
MIIVIISLALIRGHIGPKEPQAETS